MGWSWLLGSAGVYPKNLVANVTMVRLTGGNHRLLSLTLCASTKVTSARSWFQLPQRKLCILRKCYFSWWLFTGHQSGTLTWRANSVQWMGPLQHRIGPDSLNIWLYSIRVSTPSPHWWQLWSSPLILGRRLPKVVSVHECDNEKPEWFTHLYVINFKRPSVYIKNAL